MEFVRTIEARHSALKEKKVYCSMDKQKCSLERSPDETTKSQYYNGFFMITTSQMCFCSIQFRKYP